MSKVLSKQLHTHAHCTLRNQGGRLHPGRQDQIGASECATHSQCGCQRCIDERCTGPRLLSTCQSVDPWVLVASTHTPKMQTHAVTTYTLLRYAKQSTTYLIVPTLKLWPLIMHMAVSRVKTTIRSIVRYMQTAKLTTVSFRLRLAV